RHLHGLDWWDKSTLMGIDLQLLPVQHWCARGIRDRNHRLWGAWSVHSPQLRFFFGGDFALSDDLDTIGARTGGFDLAALPIGAYEPRWMMKPAHISPAEAVDTMSRINAKRAVAMHWGTFELSDEPLDEPPRALAIARKAAGLTEQEFILLQHGETRIGNGDDWRPSTH
ncbi:MAG TPA: MBL fold metallo-hydrolase, partial [Fluviicoccus sp.]|nr:MBL fold metallo-hydrolase [Fluviicoccus sp.]